MPVKDCHTEKLIMDTAMRVFFAEGRLNATTQEIADAAGVNRTLINYYFRSKKSLIATIMKKTQKEFRKNSDMILSSDLPFREKTERFIDDFLSNQYKYPYLESFITSEIIMKRNKEGLTVRLPKKQPEPIRKYISQIQDEMDKGNIIRTDPAHFLMNIFSLMVYPVVMKPLQMSILNISEPDYQKILAERKRVIMDTMLPALRREEKNNS